MTRDGNSSRVSGGRHGGGGLAVAGANANGGQSGGRGVPGARRHARLTGFILWGGLGVLALSFLTGAVAWVGEWRNARMDALEPGESFPVRLWLNLHGALFPLVCILFGYLMHQHMRIGWNQRINHVSGAAMFLTLGGLIATGTGLFYLGSESARTIVTWVHRGLGLAFPALLALHWLQAIRWARTLPPPPVQGTGSSPG